MNSSRKTTSTLWSIISLCALLLTPAFATTVQKLTFEEIVDISELIIEGEVDAVYPVESGQMIYTRVLVKVLAVLKGDYPGEFIELDFLGGERDGKVVSISGQDIPLDGEKAFYFIENSATRTVNPLTGWSQGHFRIHSDPKGNEYLETDIQQDMVELTDNKNAALAAKLRNMKFSNRLVEQAYYTPVTPDELRDAVAGFLTAK